MPLWGKGLVIRMNKIERKVNDGATPFLSRLLVCITMPLVVLVFIVVAVDYCATAETWLRTEYEKLDINDYTGMSTDDQVKAFMCMAKYMKGETSYDEMRRLEVTVNGEKVSMFNNSELSHMKDVRKLYVGVTVFKILVIVFFAATYILRKRAAPNYIPKVYLISFAVILGIFLLLGAWALIDFDSFWQVFHIVFLDLEGSTFDPAYSRMIRICPAELFLDMVIRIFVFGFIIPALIAILFGGEMLYRKVKNRKSA